MIRRPPRSTPLYSSAASDVYKRQQNPVFKEIFVLPFKSQGFGRHKFQAPHALHCSINYSRHSEPQTQKTSTLRSTSKISVVIKLERSILSLHSLRCSNKPSFSLTNSDPETLKETMALFSTVGLTFSGAPTARQASLTCSTTGAHLAFGPACPGTGFENPPPRPILSGCLLYTSDAADE